MEPHYTFLDILNSPSSMPVLSLQFKSPLHDTTQQLYSISLKLYTCFFAEDYSADMETSWSYSVDTYGVIEKNVYEYYANPQDAIIMTVQRCLYEFQRPAFRIPVKDLRCIFKVLFTKHIPL